jgi:hypothetical protein
MGYRPEARCYEQFYPRRGNSACYGAQFSKTIILADHSKISAPARSVFRAIREVLHLIVDKNAREAPDFRLLRSRNLVSF